MKKTNITTKIDKSLPLMLKRISEEYPQIGAQLFKGEDKEFHNISFKELYETTLDVSAGLLSLGAKPKDHIGLIADNRKEWLHLSFGIMGIGAADVPRGCDATELEIIHILSFSGCKMAVLENETQIKKVLNNIRDISELQTIISIENIYKERFNELKSECGAENAVLNFYNYAEIVEMGKKERSSGAVNPAEYASAVESDQLASIIYTSGTTGAPKGVTMTHRNLMTQLPELYVRIGLKPGDVAISVLPVWHSFERACEYVMMCSASTIAYSKPIGAVLLADMQKLNPVLFPSVPRIWESVYDGVFKAMKKKGGVSYYLFKFFVSIGIKTRQFERNIIGRSPHFSSITKIIYPIFSFLPWLFLLPFYGLGDLIVYRKIRAKLGNNFNLGVSGGGALPPNIDEFFWALRINIVEGYGITETAPVVCVRPHFRPVFGTLGKPLDCFDFKILDKEGNKLPYGQKGALYLKGDAVTKGYYNNPEKTAEAFDFDGWFDTGDLALTTIDGELILKGRKKNTIVLRGGENIEPVPIEMKLQESPLIFMALVLGQDQRALSALISVSVDNLMAWAHDNGLGNVAIENLIQDPTVQKMYDEEISELVNAKTGFKLFERISKVVLIPQEFTAGKELSAKGEMMRHKIEKIYSKEIKELLG